MIQASRSRDKPFINVVYNQEHDRNDIHISQRMFLRAEAYQQVAVIQGELIMHPVRDEGDLLPIKQRLWDLEDKWRIEGLSIVK